jgi:hypothetical protein
MQCTPCASAHPSAAVPTAKYDASNPAWHGHKFFENAVLKATPGFFDDEFLVGDTLMLTVDIDVQREPRFFLNSGAYFFG